MITSTFAHTEYNIGGFKMGFDIVQFEDGKVVEHWYKLQQTATERIPSGHTMTDGPTIASDLDRTEFNMRQRSRMGVSSRNIKHHNLTEQSPDCYGQDRIPRATYATAATPRT